MSGQPECPHKRVSSDLSSHTLGCAAQGRPRCRGRSWPGPESEDDAPAMPPAPATGTSCVPACPPTTPTAGEGGAPWEPLTNQRQPGWLHRRSSGPSAGRPRVPTDYSLRLHSECGGKSASWGGRSCWRAETGRGSCRAPGGQQPAARTPGSWQREPSGVGGSRRETGWPSGCSWEFGISSCHYSGAGCVPCLKVTACPFPCCNIVFGGFPDFCVKEAENL